MNGLDLAAALRTNMFLMPANGPAATKVPVEEILRIAPSAPCTPFVLRCGFAEAGPWGGVRELFCSLLGELKAKAPRLVERHDYELVHVVPELKAELQVRNLNLTDLASAEERVRNYAADRAIRIVHGLIDLLAEYKEANAPEAWLFLCIDLDKAGNISQTFFFELMRRRGASLRLGLIPICAGPWELPVVPLPVASSNLAFAVGRPSDPRCEVDGPDAARQAAAIEAGMSQDTLENSARLPAVIRLWTRAGREAKLLYWNAQALHAFNTLGLYLDAIRYGERARELFKRLPPSSNVTGLWAIFFKLFMSYLGVGAVEKAFRLAEEDVLTDSGNPDEAPMRLRLCYLMAMLNGRYRNDRDFAAAERFLEQGLDYLREAKLPEAEHWFQYVFNRNGLAMIRGFQGRPEEAIALCNTGRALLDAHLAPDQHRLHRSVLIYNTAQIHTQIGSYEKAIEGFTASIACDPNYSEYYNERGNLLLKLEDFEGAERDYRRAIELSPPYPEVWTNLGQCYRQTGRMKEAVKAYSRALDLFPAQAVAYLGRAQALEALNRIEDAIQDYGAALALNPALWQARAGRAVLQYEKGMLGESLDDLDSAIALAGTECGLYQNRSVVLADLGRHQDARRDLSRYLELRPDASDRDEVQARLQALEAQSFART